MWNVSYWGTGYWATSYWANEGASGVVPDATGPGSYWGSRYFGPRYWGRPYWGIASEVLPYDVPVWGANPMGTFRFSGDGGKTWSNSYDRSLGKIGEYSARMEVNRPGTFRDFVVEWTSSDPVKIALIGANMDVEILKH